MLLKVFLTLFTCYIVIGLVLFIHGLYRGIKGRNYESQE